MLSYLHEYHAGNHADILKHFVLTYILQYLSKKEEPFSFFDTHAGSGLYDLLDNRCIKTGEAENGIVKLMNSADDLPQSLKSYTDLIKLYYNYKRYPGSPEIERILLSDESVLNLAELHPEEYENLCRNIKESPFSKRTKKINIQLHHRNGYEMLNALTPPKRVILSKEIISSRIQRGGVLIDPSYEESSEFDNIVKTICEVHKKWSNGIIILWYPLLQLKETQIENMLLQLVTNVKKKNSNTEIIDLRLCINSKESHKETSLSEKMVNNPPRLYGSGMFVINYPWKLDDNAESALSSIVNVLSPKEGSFSVKKY